MTINRQEAQQIAARAARSLRERGRTLEREITSLQALDPNSMEAQHTARRIRQSLGRGSRSESRDT
jgi:hypothetical protein